MSCSQVDSLELLLHHVSCRNGGVLRVSLFRGELSKRTENLGAHICIYIYYRPRAEALSIVTRILIITRKRFDEDVHTVKCTREVPVRFLTVDL